jgi:dienelactone hydrolase
MLRAIASLLLMSGLATAGQIPDRDSRNTDLPDGQTHFRMPVFTDREAWLARAAFLRKQILSGAGLLPMPEKTPIHAELFGKLEHEDYTVEKVLLETYPGFYLGGNLYRPRGKQGPFPGVASPHGHWDYGRLENQPLVSVPARCINMARQGYVVFTYDMVGYNDTNQLPHGDRGPRMGGPREDLWSISIMGLQLRDSIRAVDFLMSLPDVDPGRIAVTGASGGGTQTFYLMAVDDRVKVAAPVNMVSFISQGGGCQEAANVRVGANNVMFAAMMAPRPLIMVSASGDWTRNTPVEEFPAVRSIYRLLDAEQDVEQIQIDSPHNYRKESREAVYTFFGARLLGTKGPVAEQAYRVDQAQDLLALFNRQRPPNAITTIAQYVDGRIAEAKRGVDQLRPHNAGSLEKAREAFRERLTFSILATPPSSGEIVSEKREGPGPGEGLLLGRAGKGDRIPAVWLAPRRPHAAVAPTLIVHPDGVAWVLASSQSANGLVKDLLDRGGAVLAIDAFQTGGAKAPRDREKRSFTVYNQTDDANRVQDILTALRYLRNRTNARTVNLVGAGLAGVWTCFARALEGPGVNLAADLAQFRTDTDQEYLNAFFIPGLRKAGDFHAAAVLDTHDRVLLHNAAAEFPSDWVRESAHAGGTSAEVRSSPVSDSELLAWLAPVVQTAKRSR